MVSTRKRSQSKRRLLTQLNDSGQNNIIGNTVSNSQEKATINESTVDQEVTVNNSASSAAANEKLVNVKILDR